MRTSEPRRAVLLGVTADIGLEMARRLLEDGWRVAGLGRDAARAAALDGAPGFSFHRCELTEPHHVRAAAAEAGAEGWDLFAAIAGSMTPIGPFLELDSADWERALRVNLTGPLEALRTLWPARRRCAGALFLAGGGVNGPFRNYSAYCASKLALIKMVELLHDETMEDPAEPNLFIIGPGFMRTRIHEETFAAGARAGPGLRKTETFLEQDPGTSHDDLYAHVLWCLAQGRAVSGGRNFSTAHDPWRGGGAALAAALSGDPDAHRLRRRPAGAEG